MTTELLLSVGTNSVTFDDLTLSVHVEGFPRYIAILSPADTRLLLRAIQDRIGQDNNTMWKVKLHDTIPVRWENRLMFLSGLEME